jgi:Ketopantoate reductase PanE/ApbA C terminal
MRRTALRRLSQLIPLEMQCNALCVAMGGITVDKIAANPKLLAMASTIMDEASAIGNAELLAKYGEGNFKPLGAAEKTAMMDWCKGVGEFAPSTLVDFLNGQQMEVRYLFQEPIIRSKRLGIPCPVLETVVSQIVALASVSSSSALALETGGGAARVASSWMLSPRRPRRAGTNTCLRNAVDFKKVSVSSSTMSIAKQQATAMSPKAKVVSKDFDVDRVPFAKLRQNVHTGTALPAQ